MDSERLTDEQLDAIEARYTEWSPDWRELLPDAVALVAEVRALRANYLHLFRLADAYVYATSPEDTDGLATFVSDNQALLDA